MTLLLALVIALPLLAAAILTLASRREAEPLSAAAPAAALLGLAGSCALSLHVALAGPVSLALPGALGLYANRVTGVLLMLVFAVSSLVQVFARGYLRGDVRARSFFAGASLLTGATAAVLTSATIVGLGLAWTLAGLALCSLLNLYRGLPAASAGARRTALSFAAGDLALWLAIALAVSRWGDIDLARLPSGRIELTHDGALLTVFSLLVLTAALARSSQLPFQRWLPSTLAAPTPVSALLHAGVVNAGGILLVRLSPLVGASRPAMIATFACGAATAVYGTTLMLAKPDVKGALAHSTMGQMGFMVMTCGLGGFAAAIFHLLAHGLYKATLFLNSGAAVHRGVRHRKAPPAPRAAPGTTLCAVAFAAVAAGSAVAVLGAHALSGSGSGLLIVFAVATAAAAARAILRRRLARPAAALALAGIFAGTWAYVAWLRVLTGFLSPDLPTEGLHAVSPWMLSLPILVLAAVSLVRLIPAGARWRVVHDRLYVLALSAGHVGRRRSLQRRVTRTRAGRPVLLQLRSGGVNA